MIARLNHRPMLVLALALATTVCALLLLVTLVVRVQPAPTTLPGANAKVSSTNDRGATEDGPSVIDRHAEVVARYQEGSPR